MKRIISLFQTVKDDFENNPFEKTPHYCNDKRAWLGQGYYFWESFIDNAHFWGSVITKNGEKNYLIFKSEANINHEKCCNLIDNVNHLREFEENLEIMKNNKIPYNKLNLRNIIAFRQKKVKNFNFDAIRANIVNTRSFLNPFEKYMKINNYSHYSTNKPYYIQLTPSIQICFFKIDAIDRKGYELVFPLTD